MSGYLRKLFVCALFSSAVLLAQTSHRQPNPKPPGQPSIFDQLEKQKTEPSTEQARDAAGQLRRANLAELEGELPRLIDLAQSLQMRLNTTDLETALPADLERQAKELEQIARRIHKQIRSLY